MKNLSSSLSSSRGPRPFEEGAPFFHAGKTKLFTFISFAALESDWIWNKHWSIESLSIAFTENGKRKIQVEEFQY